MSNTVILEKDQELVTLTPEAAAQYAKAEWTKAFVAVQANLPEIKKTKTATIPTNKGGSYSYSYADLTVIIDAVRPVLTKHGLAAVQDVFGEGSVSVATRIYHEAGHVESFGPLTFTVTGDPKAAGSAITYARRYALGAALGIAPDEDKDGEIPAAEPQVSVSTLVEKYGEEQVLVAFAFVRAKHGKPEAEVDVEKLQKAPNSVLEEVVQHLAESDWE